MATHSRLTWQEYVDKVGELYDVIDTAGFTDWEHDFINDLADYEERGKLFSDNEKEKIEEIYDEYIG